MSATAFQRRRREAKRKAEQEAKKAQEGDVVGYYGDPNANFNDENLNPDNIKENTEIFGVDQAENEQTAAEVESELLNEFTDEEVDNMDKDELHAALKERGINKPSNTGEKKLREALKDAIK